MQCDVLIAMDTVEMLIKSYSDMYSRYWYLKLTEIALVIIIIIIINLYNNNVLVTSWYEMVSRY